MFTSNPSLSPRPWAHTYCRGKHKQEHNFKTKKTVSPNFIETGNFTQNEKTKEFVSKKRTKKNLKKTTDETEVNNLPDKRVQSISSMNAN